MREQAEKTGQSPDGASLRLRMPRTKIHHRPFRETQGPRSGIEGDLGDWVCKIQTAYAQEANGVLALACLMCQARRTLPRGGWSNLWQTGAIAFSKRKGEMLVTIGECVEGLTAQISAYLPAAWNTLYYLARLGREAVEQLICLGRIHPGLSLEKAKALSAEYVPGTRRTNPRSKLHLRLARFAAFMQTNLGTWSQQEREMVTQELAKLAGKIQAASGTGERIVECRRDPACQFLLPRVCGAHIQPDPIRVLQNL